MSSFTFENTSGKIEVSDSFARSCQVITNLFEDTGDESNEEPIPISDQYNLNEIKEAEQFFNELQALSIDDQPYLDFVITKNNEFKEKYTHNNLNIPHVGKIADIYKKYESIMPKFAEMNTFLDNAKLMQGVCVCLISIIKQNPEDGNKILEHIMDLLQQDYTLF